MMIGLGLPAIFINRAGSENIIILIRMPGSRPGIVKGIYQGNALYRILPDTPYIVREPGAREFGRRREEIDHMPVLVAYPAFIGNAFRIKDDQGIPGSAFCIRILLPEFKGSIGSLGPTQRIIGFRAG